MTPECLGDILGKQQKLVIYRYGLWSSMQRVEEATMENMNPWTEMEPSGRTKNKTWRDHLTQSRRMWSDGGQGRHSRRKGGITGVKHYRGTRKTGTEQVSVGKLPGDLGESSSRDNGWQGRMWGQGALLLWAD